MMRERKIAALGLVIGLILVISMISPARVAAAPQTKTPPPRKTPPTSNQMTNIPYYTLRDGLSSTLTLNNLTMSAMPVTVTLYNTQGKAQTLNPITLDPHSFKQIELGDVVASDEFDSGNVEIAFNGINMAVTSQVSIYSLKDRVSFESREADIMDFMSSKLAGIVSLPRGADGYLAVSNTAMTQVTVEMTVGTRKKEFSLLPRQTNLVKLNDEVGANAPTATLVSLQHNGMPGDVLATGYVLNMKDGYSSAFTMSDPGNLRSSNLAGVHFRAGKPDPSEGFPEGTNFRSPLLLANVGTKPVNAKVLVDYTIQEKVKATPVDPKKPAPAEDKFSTVSLKTLTIAPGDVKRIELSDELASLGINGPLEEAGVDITYDGAPGSVIGQLTSVAQTGDYSFEVPIKDPADPSLMIESVYPWTIEKGTNTVLHLKNTTDRSVDALAVLEFPGGGSYNLPHMTLEPHQSLAIDFQKLKDSRKPDLLKQVFPADAEQGQLAWHQVTPATMIGRAEQTNVKDGIARSFSCASGCCDYYSFGSAWFDPSSLTGVVGGSGTSDGYEAYTSCGDYYYADQATNATDWSSDDTSVATVDYYGNVAYVAGGTANISANYHYPEYSYDGSGGSCHLDFYWDNYISEPVTVVAPYRVEPIATQDEGPVISNCGQGHYRVVTDQLQRQDGSGVDQSGILMIDEINFSGTNNLGLAAETCADDNNCQDTDTSGNWTDTYLSCSSYCPGSGESDGIQSWTYNSLGLPHSNLVVYTCSSETIDRY